MLLLLMLMLVHSLRAVRETHLERIDVVSNRRGVALELACG